MANVRARGLVVGTLVALTSVGVVAAPAPAQEGTGPPGPGLVGIPYDGPIEVDEGSKAPPPPSAGERSTRTSGAADEVAISSLGCSPTPVAFGGQTTCTFQAQNQTTAATTVDLSAVGDSHLRVTGADLGAATNDGTATVSGVPLPPAVSSQITVTPGAAPAGFFPLSGLGVGATALADEQFLNIDTPGLRWDGDVHTELGISANGYVVVGGGDADKDSAVAPQDMPDASRPNNVLAPFWTDLAPHVDTAGFRIGYVATVEPIGQRRVWVVAEWQFVEFGTTTARSAQVWLAAQDPEDTDSPGPPPEGVFFTYDRTTMTASPARPFRIGAENATGTAGAIRPPGQLPTEDYVVSSTGGTTPAPLVTWQVVATGVAAGAGDVTATATSPLLAGNVSTTASAAVTAEAAPVVTAAPDPVVVTAGDQAVFHAAASGAASVRWQVSSDEGESWDDIAGATATTLAFVASGSWDGYWVRAVFASGSGVETATADALLTVVRRATVTTVVPSPAAPTAGQAVSFTATVTPSTATGTVQFTVDGSPLGGPVAVSGGTVTSPATSSLAPGDHAVTATFSGDVDHAGSTGTGGVSVGKVETATSVALAPAAPVVGDAVTFTATVSPSSAPGTVQFTVDGEALGGPVALSGGAATSLAVTGLERGTHVVVATYSGDATRAISTSGPVTFTVARRATDTTVQVAPDAPQRRDEITFTATVDPAPAGGTVQFLVGGVLGDPVAVGPGGVAIGPPVTHLAAGGHTVAAVYSGDEVHGPSLSSGVAFTVARLPSSVAITVTPAVRAAGEDVTVEVEVAPGPVGGTVQLALDGVDTGPPLPLDGEGRATGTLPGVAQGARTVTATYSGDADLLPSADDAGFVVHSLDEAFVRRAFVVVLGRAADAGGVAHWLGALDAGASPEEVTRRMALSGEGRGRLVDQAYLRALGRRPDADGRAHWAGRLASGLAAEDLLATLVASAEGYQRSGGSPQGTAVTLFRVHLGRAAGTGDLAYWTERLAAAGSPGGRRVVALAFGRSAEATRVAVRGALVGACGGPGATGDQGATLSARWPASGRHPLRLAGSALALACPPGAIASP